MKATACPTARICRFTGVSYHPLSLFYFLTLFWPFSPTNYQRNKHFQQILPRWLTLSLFPCKTETPRWQVSTINTVDGGYVAFCWVAVSLILGFTVYSDSFLHSCFMILRKMILLLTLCLLVWLSRICQPLYMVSSKNNKIREMINEIRDDLSISSFLFLPRRWSFLS